MQAGPNLEVCLVAERVLESHFLPDIQGNLRAYCQQEVRCNKCAKKYRRVPVAGRCHECGSKLTLTVHEKGVKKYLEPTKRLAAKYDVDTHISDSWKE